MEKLPNKNNWEMTPVSSLNEDKINYSFINCTTVHVRSNYIYGIYLKLNNFEYALILLIRHTLNFCFILRWWKIVEEG